MSKKLNMSTHRNIVDDLPPQFKSMTHRQLLVQLATMYNVFGEIALDAESVGHHEIAMKIDTFRDGGSYISNHDKKTPRKRHRWVKMAGIVVQYDPILDIFMFMDREGNVAHKKAKNIPDTHLNRNN